VRKKKRRKEQKDKSIIMISFIFHLISIGTDCLTQTLMCPFSKIFIYPNNFVILAVIIFWKLCMNYYYIFTFTCFYFALFFSSLLHHSYLLNPFEIKHSTFDLSFTQLWYQLHFYLSKLLLWLRHFQHTISLFIY